MLIALYEQIAAIMQKTHNFTMLLQKKEQFYAAFSFSQARDRDLLITWLRIFRTSAEKDFPMSMLSL